MLPGANIQQAIARMRQQQMQGGKVGFGGMDQLGGGGGMPPQMGGDPMGGMGAGQLSDLPGSGGGMIGMPMPAQMSPGGPGFNSFNAQPVNPAVGLQGVPVQTGGSFAPAMPTQIPGQPQPFMFHGAGGNATGPSMSPQGPGVSSMQPGIGQPPGKAPGAGVQTRPAVQPTKQPPVQDGTKPVKPAVAQQQARVGGLVNQIADFKPSTPTGAMASAPGTAEIAPGDAREMQRVARANIAAARPKAR